MAKLPLVRSEVEVADFETELVVLVPSRRRAHLLDPALALVFDSCHRGDDRVDLVAEFKRSPAAPDDLGGWIDQVLAEFERSGVVENPRP